ncbi:hypothetical protein P4U47_18550 [Bacillus altitudinis]|uniref:hypothetical protein n=1 Tax=Bacillus altitudinis TaxID=293387 RepID=UPI002E1C54DA|nr:hypothetical protein [Bacillus altitudinis]
MGIIDINFYFQSDNVQAVKSFLLNPSLWGSLAGSSLSSIVAIGIMRKNISRDRTLKHKEKLEEFLVEAVFFRDCVDLLIKRMLGYASYQHLEENIPRGDIEFSLQEQLAEIKVNKKMCQRDILRYLSQIKSVDRTKFSYEYYQHYFKIRYICENQLEIFYDHSLENESSGVAEIIKDEIKSIKIELDKLNEIISIKEREFKKIN